MPKRTTRATRQRSDTPKLRSRITRAHTPAQTRANTTVQTLVHTPTQSRANAKVQSRAHTAAQITLEGQPLAISDVVRVARGSTRVALGRKAVDAMQRSRAIVERALTKGEPHYGINTGFGALAHRRISDADLATLQRNLVRSHSAGCCDPLRVEDTRAMMLLLAASLARGLSGVRPVVAETILAMLNANITPLVPSVGSVGASGDLAPLAAVARVAIGEGRVLVGGRERPARASLRQAGIVPLELGAKEGLALINGTHLMAGQAALLVHDARLLVDAACAALALSIEACRATDSFLDARLYAARRSSAAARVARVVGAMLRGSAILVSHRENDPRVQDPYSLRAGPTVLGAAAHVIDGVANDLERGELGAVTDNPLVIPARFFSGSADAVPAKEDVIVSGANFHGAPVAIPLDCLAIALCHIAGVSERRTYLITGAFEPESQLKPFLAPRPGLQSGLMIAQYTAAACVNELMGLAMPASVANVPTCAGMEDYNSFGPRAAAKARRGIELASRVIGVELVCAAQGMEEHRPLRSGKGAEAAFELVRSVVPTLTDDRALTDDIERAAKLVRSGAFTDLVRA